MPKYMRKWPCAICGKKVYWDSDKQTLSCGCGVYHASFVNLDVFTQLPKYDRKIFEKKEIAIDSAKFVVDDKILICDRKSIVRSGEDPRLILSFVNYPKEDKMQLKIAISGDFHREKLSYYVKNPKRWKEKMWIMIPMEALKQILDFLSNRNPEYLHSWM